MQLYDDCDNSFGASIPRQPSMVRVTDAMTQASAFMSEVVALADRLCGPIPAKISGEASLKHVNGFLDAVSNDAATLMRDLDKARASLARISREFP